MTLILIYIPNFERYVAKSDKFHLWDHTCCQPWGPRTSTVECMYVQSRRNCNGKDEISSLRGWCGAHIHTPESTNLRASIKYFLSRYYTYLSYSRGRQEESPKVLLFRKTREQDEQLSNDLDVVNKVKTFGESILDDGSSGVCGGTAENHPYFIRVMSANSLVVVVHYTSLCLYYTISIYNREKESATLALQRSDTPVAYLDSCRHANVDNPTGQKK